MTARKSSNAFSRWFVAQFGRRTLGTTNGNLSDEELDNKIITLSANLTSAQCERDRRRWWDETFNSALYAWQASEKHNG